jgi:cytochrome c oxidase subunit I+III
MPSEPLAWASFWVIFLGFNAAFFPMPHLGLRGMPRRVYTYLPEQNWGGLNLLATCGAFVLALGLLMVLANVLRSRRRGALAGDNPWGAGTLEWAAASPPEPHNFTRPPTVRGREPLWEDPATTPVVTGLALDTREVLVTTPHDAEAHHRNHIAGDSVWPFLAAVVTGATFVGLVFTAWAFPLGMAGLFVTLLGWFWLVLADEGAGADPPRPAAARRRRGGAAVTTTTTRPTLDVSQLPTETRDSRSPVWWGNTLFMLIETTTVALLLASYLYLWRNYP